MKSSIVLKQLELNLSLGWPENERSQLQSVMLDIYIDFIEPPHACTTDELDEKTNYDALNQTILKKIANRSFRLIERF
jgi:FolB domain-containing protein